MKEININEMINQLNNMMETEGSGIRFKKKKNRKVISIYYKDDKYIESVIFKNRYLRDTLNEYFKSIGLFIPEYSNFTSAIWWQLEFLTKMNIILVWE